MATFRLDCVCRALDVFRYRFFEWMDLLHDSAYLLRGMCCHPRASLLLVLNYYQSQFYVATVDSVRVIKLAYAAAAVMCGATMLDFSTVPRDIIKSSAVLRAVYHRLCLYYSSGIMSSLKASAFIRDAYRRLCLLHWSTIVMTSFIWCLILLPRVRASDWRQSASVTSGTHSYDFVALAATERVPLFALQPWLTQQAPSRFDSDSFPVGIDTQSSRCISFNKAHFEDLHLHRVGECTGIGGHQVEIEGVGTLVFSIQDDAGLWHTHRVPNSLYIPKAKKVLICPQHWSQTAQDHSPLIHGTCEITTHVGTILFWNQRRYKRTLSLHPLTNTPIFYSRAGNRIIEAFTATFESLDASATAPREQAILLPPNSLLSHHPEHGDAWNGEELIHTSRGAGQPMHTIPPDAPCPYHPASE